MKEWELLLATITAIGIGFFFFRYVNENIIKKAKQEGGIEVLGHKVSF